MMKKLLIAATALAGVAAVPAQAQTALNVQGIVAPYCSINLSNVSSGTASIAFTAAQQVANLNLACNAPGGAKLTLNPANGDLYNGTLGRINYSMELKSPSEAAFAIAPTDTAPGDAINVGLFTRQTGAYKQAVANGVPLQLWLDVNVATDVGQLDFNGVPLFAANAAPAGTYTEVFNFTVSPL
jgi:hypothetical protein